MNKQELTQLIKFDILLDKISIIEQTIQEIQQTNPENTQLLQILLVRQKDLKYQCQKQYDKVKNYYLTQLI